MYFGGVINSATEWSELHMLCVSLLRTTVATFKVEAANKDQSHQKRLRGKSILYGERIQVRMCMPIQCLGILVL